MAVNAQEIVNSLVVDKGLANSHVVAALSADDVSLNIGQALTDLRTVFSELQMTVITDELAYAANDKVLGTPGYSVDGASRFYYQLLLSGKEELAFAINQILMLEKSK